MASKTFYMLDVFAMEKYGGNGLAVFRDAADLSDKEMQYIAREMNQAETTFILSDSKRRGGYDVRIFSPEKELPFAGHPTLGTAYIIQQEIIKEPVTQLVLNLKAGQIPVSLNYDGDKLDILWMKQKPASFGKKFGADDVAKIVGLNPEDIDDSFPIQEDSSGLPFIIVPVKSLEVLIKAKPDGDAILEFVEHAEGKVVTADDTVVKRLEAAGQIAVRYVDKEGRTGTYPANPNGSVAGIAGLCDPTGRIFGLMPHPDRHFEHTHHPHWTRRDPKGPPDGLTVFKNAVRFWSG